MALIWIGIRTYFMRRQELPFTLDNLLWVGPAADLFKKVGSAFLAIGLVYSVRNAVIAYPYRHAVGIVDYVEGDKAATPRLGRSGYSRSSYEWPVVTYSVIAGDYKLRGLPTWPGHYHNGQHVTVFYVDTHPSRSWIRADLIDFPLGLFFAGVLFFIIGKRTEYLEHHW